eukprot:7844076-Lingulodinium_polyedra.AAC.1
MATSSLYRGSVSSMWTRFYSTAGAILSHNGLESMLSWRRVYATMDSQLVSNAILSQPIVET